MRRETFPIKLCLTEVISHRLPVYDPYYRVQSRYTYIWLLTFVFALYQLTTEAETIKVTWVLSRSTLPALALPTAIITVFDLLEISLLRISWMAF